jgi:hypothetical protein
MYGLLRNNQWISVPDDHDPDQLVPCPLMICPTPQAAWSTPCLDEAINRQQLLKMCWGLSTEIRALP